jgi:hypothetical protein
MMFYPEFLFVVPASAGMVIAIDFANVIAITIPAEAGTTNTLNPPS